MIPEVRTCGPRFPGSGSWRWGLSPFLLIDVRFKESSGGRIFLIGLLVVVSSSRPNLKLMLVLPFA